MEYFEVNFDGLVGPTHHYGGLAMGNMASQKNKNLISHPREAALQGLSKMKLLHDMGVKQAVLPPQIRPDVGLLKTLGYEGSLQTILTTVHKETPWLLSQCSSASAMWVANAATISPSVDTRDKLLHLTPANLSSHLHRALEVSFTERVLRRIFSNDHYFKVHEPLPPQEFFSDEGAANVCRMSSCHGKQGLTIFVFGKKAGLIGEYQVGRQSKEAFEAIQRRHTLRKDKVFYIQQNPDAIRKGVFHNDVIAVSNENVLLYHEKAFANAIEFKALQRAINSQIQMPYLIEIKEKELTIEEAVRTYLFNSQIITLPNQEMILLAPIECKQNKKVKKLIETKILVDTPIKKVIYMNLRQSMRNGGGPACLRLRVVLSAEQIKKISGNVFLNESLYQQLMEWVERFYPETLVLKDLMNYRLIQKMNEGLLELEGILKLKGLYRPLLPMDPRHTSGGETR